MIFRPHRIEKNVAKRNVVLKINLFVKQILKYFHEFGQDQHYIDQVRN